jgi:hypothetical protein
MNDDEHEIWLNECMKTIAEVLQVPEKNIYLKTRKRKEGRGSQYQKAAESKNEFIVHENGLSSLLTSAIIWTRVYFLIIVLPGKWLKNKAIENEY